MGRRYLIVDTCYAAGAYSREFRDRVLDDQIVFIAAADRETESQESKKLGHGVFTWSLINALDGKADYNKDGIIRISEIAKFVIPDVVDATKGRQKPEIVYSNDLPFLRLN